MYYNVNELVAEKLKKCRKQCGLSQQQVAQALNIDRSTYSYYELGHTTPGIEKIPKLAKIFNISPTLLLPDENDALSLTLSDVDDEENLSEMARLSDEEKDLLIRYRLLGADERTALMEKLDELRGASKN